MRCHELDLTDIKNNKSDITEQMEYLSLSTIFLVPLKLQTIRGFMTRDLSQTPIEYLTESINDEDLGAFMLSNFAQGNELCPICFDKVGRIQRRSIANVIVCNRCGVNYNKLLESNATDPSIFD